MLPQFIRTILHHSFIALLITLISININYQLTEYIPYKPYEITNIDDDYNQLNGSEYETYDDQGCDVVVVYFDVVSEDGVILYYFIQLLLVKHFHFLHDGGDAEDSEAVDESHDLDEVEETLVA